MSDPMIAPESFELKPVDRPWRLSLPRSLHGWRAADENHCKVFPDDLPGMKAEFRVFVAYAWFLRGNQFVAALSWSDGHEVVVGSGGRVREHAWVATHQRRFAAPAVRLHRKLVAAGLPGLPHAEILGNARKADLALAVGVAGVVVRRLASTGPTSRDGRAWLKRQLDGLGEKGDA